MTNYGSPNWSEPDCMYVNVILFHAKVNFQLTVTNHSNNFNSLQLNSSLVITQFLHFSFYLDTDS